MSKKQEMRYSERTDVRLGEIPTRMPVIPLRDVVVFPSMVYPVLIGRESSLKAAMSSSEGHKYVFLATQKNALVDDPGPEQIYSNGTVAKIVQIVKIPNGLMKVLVDGVVQGAFERCTYNGQFLEAEITIVDPQPETNHETDALTRHTSALFTEYSSLNRNIQGDVIHG